MTIETTKMLEKMILEMLQEHQVAYLAVRSHNKNYGNARFKITLEEGKIGTAEAFYGMEHLSPSFRFALAGEGLYGPEFEDYLKTMQICIFAGVYRVCVTPHIREAIAQTSNWWN